MPRLPAVILLLTLPLGADVFQARYEADKAPNAADPPWGVDGEARVEIADGVLKAETPVDSAYALGRDWVAEPGKGCYVRLRLRMLTYKGNRNVGGAALRIADGAHEQVLLLSTDSIVAFGTKLGHQADLTDGFHDIRVGCSGTDFTVDLDGRRVIDGKGCFTTRAGGRTNAIQFGDLSQMAGASWQLDLLAYSLGRAANLSPAYEAALDPAKAQEGEAVTVDVRAADPDGDEVRYTAKSLPEGAMLDEKLGRLTWTPSFKSAGSHAIDVIASDGDWATERRIEIEVADVNRPPVFTQPKKDEAAYDAGTMIVFSLRADDPDEEALTYRVEGLPNGAAFDPTTRMLRWTPLASQVGKHAIRFFASDGHVEVERAYTFRIESKR